MAMNKQELQAKYDAAEEKVAKRLNTITKLAKKLGLDAKQTEALLADYREAALANKNDFMVLAITRPIVYKYLEEKPERDANGQFNWDNSDYNSKLEQLAENLSKLFEVERVANNWKVKLEIQINKEKAPKIQVLWDFLTNWEENARKWYINNSEYLLEKYNEYYNIVHDYLIDNNYAACKTYEEKKDFSAEFNDYMKDEYNIRLRYRFSTCDVEDYLLAQYNIPALTNQLTSIRFRSTNENEFGYHYDNHFGYEAQEGEYYIANFDLDKLNRILSDEKQGKYEDLINRVTAVVGEITDVSNLSIGRQQGELNGTIEGINGKCSVETIGAGGYNIQCFHYRVLIHKLTK